MKKYLISALIIVTFSCTQDVIEDVQMVPNESLSINLDEGIKLENYIVTDEVLVNLKINKTANYTIIIENIIGNVVSKERIDLKFGNNIHKIYVKALPVSSYTVKLVDESDRLIGVEIFSMQN